MGAAVAGGEVFADGELVAAEAAEDGRGVVGGGGPGLDGVVGEGVVTVFAGVEEAAAGHLHGDDVEGGVVVEAAGLRVELEAVDLGRWRDFGIGRGGLGHVSYQNMRRAGLARGAVSVGLNCYICVKIWNLRRRKSCPGELFSP